MKKLWQTSPMAVILFTIAVVSDAVMFYFDWRIAAVQIGVAVVALLIAVIRVGNSERQSYYHLKSLSKRLDTLNQNALSAFPLPVLLAGENGKILWYNDLFRKNALSHSDFIGKNLSDISPALMPDQLNASSPIDIEFNNRKYSLLTAHTANDKIGYYTLYFFDNTDLKNAVSEYEQSHPVVMLINIDSIEESLKNVKASDQYAITSGIQGILENWIAETRGFLKISSSDRFFAVIEARNLKKIIENRFSILDKVRGLSYMGISGITLSIGVGCGENLRHSEEIARQALDMALGRGGDQAAVKMNGGYQFYGGASKGVEKRTKVKTRVVANGIVELIKSSDNVLIMGHRFADLDAFGASVGLLSAVRHLGKPAKIVMSRKRSLALPLLERLEQSGLRDAVIEPQEAFGYLARKTLVIVVDTHRQDFVEYPELLKNSKNIVIIDHHRKTVEHIDNAAIFFHEPNASSACEMVAEMLQYISDTPFISKMEAEALLAGIMLDTRSFVIRTGVRTFEAAAYLRSCGAETASVKQLFSNSIQDYKLRTNVISTADIYNGCAIAIAEFESPDIRVIAAQAADELLNISGVKASFVLFRTEDQVNISARSMGQINVQLVMESIGGGGHHTMAASQLNNITLADAKVRLLEAIDGYYISNIK